MRVGIMQPYLFPYIGYFQLIDAVDRFVVYDNIKYTKKGWINRNRLLRQGTDAYFSVPLKKGSDSLDICQRELASDFNRDKLLNQFAEAYRQAPQYADVFPFLQEVFSCDRFNLFEFLFNALRKTCARLRIDTEILVSSGIGIDHALRKQDRVMALCEALGATVYVNPIGGVELYSVDEFKARGLQLQFLKSRPCVYPQFGNEFVPWLSIIDVMMFNAVDVIRTAFLPNYEMVC